MALFASPIGHGRVRFICRLFISCFFVCLLDRVRRIVQHFDAVVIDKCITWSGCRAFERRNFGGCHRLHFNMRCRRSNRYFIVMRVGHRFVANYLLMFAYLIANVATQFLRKYEFLTTEIASAVNRYPLVFFDFLTRSHHNILTHSFGPDEVFWDVPSTKPNRLTFHRKFDIFASASFVWVHVHVLLSPYARLRLGAVWPQPLRQSSVRTDHINKFAFDVCWPHAVDTRPPTWSTNRIGCSDASLGIDSMPFPMHSLPSILSHAYAIQYCT